MDPRILILLLMKVKRAPRPSLHLMFRCTCIWAYFVSSSDFEPWITRAIYVVSDSFGLKTMDSKAIHLIQTYAVII